MALREVVWVILSIQSDCKPYGYGLYYAAIDMALIDMALYALELTPLCKPKRKKLAAMVGAVRSRAT